MNQSFSSKLLNKNFISSLVSSTMVLGCSCVSLQIGVILVSVFLKCSSNLYYWRFKRDMVLVNLPLFSFSSWFSSYFLSFELFLISSLTLSRFANRRREDVFVIFLCSVRFSLLFPRELINIWLLFSSSFLITFTGPVLSFFFCSSFTRYYYLNGLI